MPADKSRYPVPQRFDVVPVLVVLIVPILGENHALYLGEAEFGCLGLGPGQPAEHQENACSEIADCLRFAHNTQPLWQAGILATALRSEGLHSKL